MRPLAILALLASASAAAPPAVVRNLEVWKEPGRFGGWPANFGIWSWGNEIVVGFTAAYFKNSVERHAVDNTRPSTNLLARSLDGGETWRIEEVSFLAGPDRKEKEPVDPPGNIDFQHPDFAMVFRMSGIHTGASRFYYSTNRCKSWQGPYKFPLFGTKGIAARTDYIVNGKRDCTVFVTAAKANEKEGRVMSARTRDGGRTWKFGAWIGPEPEGYNIMPSSVRLSRREILTTIRCRQASSGWIDAYLSTDNGKSFGFLSRPVEYTGSSSNPPSMIKLKDGRLALTYGYRAVPYGIRAKLSADNGRTWGPEIILRGDGGRWDLGYPRTVQRPDGKIVTIYYFNDDPDKERFIAATIWDPGTVR